MSEGRYEPIAMVAAQTSGSLRVALIVLIAAVLLAPLGLRILQRAFDPFELIVLSTVVYGAMFVIGQRHAHSRRPGARRAANHTRITATYTKMLVVGLV